jgi:hypothetical protein
MFLSVIAVFRLECRENVENERKIMSNNRINRRPATVYQGNEAQQKSRAEDDRNASQNLRSRRGGPTSSEDHGGKFQVRRGVKNRSTETSRAREKEDEKSVPQKSRRPKANSGKALVCKVASSKNFDIGKYRESAKNFESNASYVVGEIFKLIGSTHRDRKSLIGKIEILQKYVQNKRMHGLLIEDRLIIAMDKAQKSGVKDGIGELKNMVDGSPVKGKISYDLKEIRDSWEKRALNRIPDSRSVSPENESSYEDEDGDDDSSEADE